jgi:hypothetical protein
VSKSIAFNLCYLICFSRYEIEKKSSREFETRIGNFQQANREAHVVNLVLRESIPVVVDTVDYEEEGENGNLKR